MSRRDEVEASKWGVDRGDLAIGRFRLQCTSPHDIAKWHNDKAITLASEVDERDAVINKLLSMLEPGEKPTQIGGDMAMPADSALAGIYMTKRELHARALEIAGRKPK